MIRSMTGFASVSHEDAGSRASVTMKSVNHRFLDLALKAPQALAGFEAGIRARVQQRPVVERADPLQGIGLPALVPHGPFHQCCTHADTSHRGRSDGA